MIRMATFKIKSKYLKRTEFSFISSGLRNEVKIKAHADNTKKILELSDPLDKKDFEDEVMRTEEE